MKIGIITAMPEERRAVAKNLKDLVSMNFGVLRADSFSCYENEFLLLESGIGFDNAARATEIIIREWKPDLIISTGFCGGIATGLESGDVVVAESIIIVDGSIFEEIPVRLSCIGHNFVALQMTEGKRIFGGLFVSTSKIVSKEYLAQMLASSYSNPVVEMESGAVAIIAAEKHIPLLAIRAVSDNSAEELGFSLDDFCDTDMRRIRFYKVLVAVLKKPGVLPQLLRLRQSSHKAAESLTSAFSRLFAVL